MIRTSKAWIFGGGGHARVVHSFVKNHYEEVHFILAEHESAFFDKFNEWKDDHVYIAIGDNLKREALFIKIKNLGAILPICRGPNTYIDDTAKIGEGVFVGAGVVILVNSLIGDNVIINTGSSVDHDCVVESHAQITAGVRLAGGSKIGRGSLLGMGVITIPGVVIGDNVQIMAGSVVVKDIEKNFIVGGYPARVIKKIGE